VRGGIGGPAFAVEDFRLYRSRLTGGGAVYEELVRYPLAGGVGRVGLEAERAGGG
jgi:hypothetical protein